MVLRKGILITSLGHLDIKHFQEGIERQESWSLEGSADRSFQTPSISAKKTRLMYGGLLDFDTVRWSDVEPGTLPMPRNARKQEKVQCSNMCCQKSLTLMIDVSSLVYEVTVPNACPLADFDISFVGSMPSSALALSFTQYKPM